MEQSQHGAAVIGGGPAGLMAAETLARAGVQVTVYERMPRVGRKLLLAGRGGLNLTHSEPLESFLSRYREAEPNLRAAIEAFPPSALRAWCEDLGQETFVGTSGRVFPRVMKTSPLLRAWLQRLDALGVEFKLRHRWIGWDSDGGLLFETPDGQVRADADGTILALGGASWPHLGSDGSWVQPLQGDVRVAPLEAANSGIRIAWSEVFRTRFAGAPLKRIALTVGSDIARGEAMITADGLEGGAVYALSAPIRNELTVEGEAKLRIDLRPDEGLEDLAKRLEKPRGKQSLATFLRKALNLDPPAIGLLQEAAHAEGRPLNSRSADEIARLTKAIPLRATATAPIDRAISTAGGVMFDNLDETFMLRARPGTFVAGEMIDWEAPTGGYLLQACFATGRAAAHGALAYLAERPST
ncbi:TIGR03862 family flavoprotein [Hyphomicrobium sp.]|uniref:TIGR03862 family flavoprotein n=1 Tax=Hyphomicrobium sp. TaxID=82 RepID=UPI002E3366EC|nr:TIGR03862 family flavoprotein [Hyphomicrobium sp.]HEX2843243.1 TIGR03862 family flavoprotein [Hyphomicrobium sp.]